LYLVVVLIGASSIIWLYIRPVYEEAIIEERITLISEYQQQRIREAENFTGYWLLSIQELREQIQENPQNVESMAQNHIRLFPDLTAIHITELRSGEYFEIRTSNANEIPSTDLIREISYPVPDLENIRVTWLPASHQFFLLSEFDIDDQPYLITAQFQSINLEEILLQNVLGDGSFSAIWFMDGSVIGSGNRNLPNVLFQQITAVREQSIDGVPHLLVTSPVRSMPVVHATYADLELVKLPVNQIFIQNLGLLVIAFVVLALGGVFLANRVRQPVQQFIEDVEPFANYDFSRFFRDSPLPELAGITDKMEEIRKKLAHYQRINVDKIILQEQRNRLLMTYAVEMVAIYDENDRFTFVNKSLTSLFDQISPGGQLLAIGDFFALKGVSVNMESNSTEKISGYVTDTRYRELEINTGDGHRFFINAHLMNLQGVDSRFIGGMMLMNDVTKDREMEQMRTEMIHTIIHELQNPVFGCVGLTELLMVDNDLPENRRKEYYEVMSESLHTLSGLISRFLDITRLESGSLVLQKEPIHLYPVIAKVVKSFKRTCEEKNITIDFNIDDTPIIHAAEDLMEDMIRNLVSNAIKYGDNERTIEIELKSSEGYSILGITDHGYGIPEGERDKIFRKFYRAKAHRTIDGNGLGLSHVKEIVTRHNGTISVESNPEIGTRFRISLPENGDTNNADT
jgi:signal transduction histidine kinase